MTQAQDSQAYRTAAEEALRDVDALGVTAPIDRAVLLGGILLARLGTTSIPLPAANGGQRGDPGAPSEIAPAEVGDDSIGKIAARLQLSRDVVDQVYHAGEDGPTVIVSSRRLAAGKAAATRTLAQLVAAGRQASDVEEWTDAAVIREVVSEFNRYDSANFASTIASMDDVFLFRGKGQSRSVKVSRPGWEKIAEVVRELVEVTQ